METPSTVEPHQVTQAVFNLQSLLDQVPSATLRSGQVAGDKPGILAGELPVCRMREGAEGAAYAALIIEAVNALPTLLKTLEKAAEPVPVSGDSAGDEGSPLRQQVEAKITQTLALLPGFKQSMTATWAKLIYAAVEPWLIGGREVLSAVPQPASAPGQLQSQVDAQVRLDAVTDFCSYMLAQEDAESRPNEYALEQWVNDWAKADQKVNA
ncbi:hypothetical protein [Stutzerimonas stutzeri]|uniref:hypothetical protein n=1 Tax=Stutzerimonas stutzeri TaxID=316 RepID=UPI00265CC652|nr:hypothetical protein [Stutzerimonas stutzeri]MCF6783382.1 hypothetical protein [Stutzerimonas stutzeri]